MWGVDVLLGAIAILGTIWIFGPVVMRALGVLPLRNDVVEDPARADQFAALGFHSVGISFESAST